MKSWYLSQIYFHKRIEQITCDCRIRNEPGPSKDGLCNEKHNGIDEQSSRVRISLKSNLIDAPLLTL